MGTRNFGLGSRDMERAGQMALNNAARIGAIAFGTAATNAERWGQFCKYATHQLNVKKMEEIDRGSVIAYGESLQSLVEADELEIATAHHYISAVNSVMEKATQGRWKTISATHDCGIARRSYIAKKNKAISQVQHERLINVLPERIGVLIPCQRHLGLRFEESTKIDAQRALAEATSTGVITIEFGTKGGLIRSVPAYPEAVLALVHAAEIQGLDWSMIPSSMTYAEFQSLAYRELQLAGGGGFHGERHWFAQTRYAEISKAPAPIVAGWTRNERFKMMAVYLDITEQLARERDADAREQVAQELGHTRLEITDVYLG